MGLSKMMKNIWMFSYLEIGLPPSFNPGSGLEQSRNFLDILWALMSSLAGLQSTTGANVPVSKC
jgi:hypothetical protein